MKNLIETKLTEANKTKITEFITDLENELAGKLVALTEEERSRYGSINEQNKLLVNKTRDLHRSNPAMSSPDVNWVEFGSDYETRVFFESCADRLESIVYQMRSTKILHDHDNYQDSLNQYAYEQYKKGAGEPGYAERVAEKKQFFNRTGTAKNASDNNNKEE